MKKEDCPRHLDSEVLDKMQDILNVTVRNLGVTSPEYYQVREVLTLLRSLIGYNNILIDRAMNGLDRKLNKELEKTYIAIGRRGLDK